MMITSKGDVFSIFVRVAPCTSRFYQHCMSESEYDIQNPSNKLPIDHLGDRGNKTSYVHSSVIKTSWEETTEVKISLALCMSLSSRIYESNACMFCSPVLGYQNGSWQANTLD
jgi:hypothetical protein